jgi:hypothetical protein
MNPEHLKEQQEAVEAASQELESCKVQLRSGHRSGWLASMALLAALIVPVWLFYTDHQLSRDAAIKTEIQRLKLSDTRRQDQIASLRNDSARQDKSNEKIADQRQAQAAQIAMVLVDLSEQRTHQAQLEQEVRELILGRAEDKRELEQLKLENKVLQEQVAANDTAQAKQADLMRELRRTIEDKNQGAARKRGFLGIFHNK